MDEKVGDTPVTPTATLPERGLTADEAQRHGALPPAPTSRASGLDFGRRAMARKKVSTTVYIEPEQAERLKLLHERTKVPIAVYIREGIELALAKYDHLLPGQLPLEPKRPPQG